jgi:hypothetical protein
LLRHGSTSRFAQAQVNRPTAHSAEEVITGVRQVGQDCQVRFGVYTAVSLEGGDPDLSATAIDDRWHFWYLAEDGAMSLRSVGDESAERTTRIIFSDFYYIPNAELVPAAVGEAIIREWVERKRLSDAIRWVER